MSMSAEPSRGFPSGEPEIWTFDDIALGLRELRLSAGNPSFAEIALRLARARVAAGMTPEAARVARSTIYDSFRDGRKRVNPGLVGEIADALTGDAALAGTWRLRCMSALGSAQAQELDRQSGYRSERPSDHVDGLPSAVAMDVESTPDSDVQAIAHRSTPAVKRPSGTVVLWVILGCIAVNIAGSALQSLLDRTLPLFLDMVGTAIASVALGPLAGVAVGVATNLGAVAAFGVSSLPFTAVQIVGALIWGFGIHRWRLGRSPIRFVGLNIAVAVACSLTAVIVLVVVFGGDLMMSTPQNMADTLVQGGFPLVLAIFVSNLMTSLADKFVAGFVALTVSVTVLQSISVGDLFALGPGHRPPHGGRGQQGAPRG